MLTPFSGHHTTRSGASALDALLLKHPQEYVNTIAHMRKAPVGCGDNRRNWTGFI